MDNRFNLIDEPWIPVADVGRVSLAQMFGNPDYRALGGNPVQKNRLDETAACDCPSRLHAHR